MTSERPVRGGPFCSGPGWAGRSPCAARSREGRALNRSARIFEPGFYDEPAHQSLKARDQPVRTDRGRGAGLDPREHAAMPRSAGRFSLLALMRLDQSPSSGRSPPWPPETAVRPGFLVIDGLLRAASTCSATLCHRAPRTRRPAPFVGGRAHRALACDFGMAGARVPASPCSITVLRPSWRAGLKSAQRSRALTLLSRSANSSASRCVCRRSSGYREPLGPLPERWNRAAATRSGSVITSTIAGPSWATAAASAASSSRAVGHADAERAAVARVRGEVRVVQRGLPDVPLARALLLGDLAELAVVEQHVGDVHAVLDRGRELGHVLARSRRRR